MLKDKVVIVTGGSGLIGREIGKDIVRKGGIAFYERVHSSSINGIEQWKQISDKATYYRKMFE